MDRESLIASFLKKQKEHDDLEQGVKAMRFKQRDLDKDYALTEYHLTALQSIGQIVGEVLKPLENDKCTSIIADIIKASSGPRYVVNVRTKLDKSKLVVGSRVSLNMTTLTIMKILPREVDPQVYSMQSENPGEIGFNDIGGLNDQIRVLRETVELPITNPELFKRVGIKPPKVLF